MHFLKLKSSQNAVSIVNIQGIFDELSNPFATHEKKRNIIPFMNFHSSPKKSKLFTGKMKLCILFSHLPFVIRELNRRVILNQVYGFTVRGDDKSRKEAREGKQDQFRIFLLCTPHMVVEQKVSPSASKEIFFSNDGYRVLLQLTTISFTVVLTVAGDSRNYNFSNGIGGKTVSLLLSL